MRIAAVRCRGPDQPFPICYAGVSMPSRYAQWMYDWETRLTSVDNNRVVRPLDWGLDWTHNWPGRNGGPAGQGSRELQQYFSHFNDRIIRDSDNFYSYQKPSDFRLERREVQVF